MIDYIDAMHKIQLEKFHNIANDMNIEVEK